MKIDRFVIGPVGTNCYIVRNEDTDECFVTDPAACPPELVGHIRKEGLNVKAVLLTHGHFDHIMGLDDFLKEFPVPVYAFSEEKPLLESAELNSSLGMFGRPYTFSGAEYVSDGQILHIAGFEIRVIHTPGHTAGGCCYYIPAENVLISGDTLFRASVGRTDLPTGSMGDLVRSVREKLFVLPEETKVYPGHMEETTIGYEKKYNPFV
ncbi:MAG TPA: MBL fold metallo-hydrolase [Candidatus Mediterraneibacter stercoravium]|uniref:MBL fold metallo-hydrolase n=1 Tax=Candidatus Mediterraneibacter stercoravium TaxID=2838685 RepID=A0A9D2G683_9FIRM|nr:MBL fold metallo-hydrolase [Candidatus Mediterraneibacter stercoravium]